MKNFFAFTACLLVLFVLNANAQNERVLLFECFTNTGCEPCAQQNPALDALINANADRIAAIKYHMNWPDANDPMFLHNTADNMTRKDFYHVNSVPYTVVDGIRFASSPAPLNQSIVNAWLSIPSPLEMRLAYEVDKVANTIAVRVVGRASAAIQGNISLYVGVIEREIRFDSAPGPNGEQDFHNVMKKLLPSASGFILGDMASGDCFDFSFSWELDNVCDNDQLDAIAWVQNQNTREVYQACKSSESIVPFHTDETTISRIFLYPNPTEGLLTIDSEGEQLVTIYNMVGQHIYEDMSHGRLQVNMKPYGSGIYAVKVGAKTMKIVVR